MHASHTAPRIPAPLPMLPRIKAVEAEPGTWSVIATFVSGERRRYDVAPLLAKGIFQQIADPVAFAAVRTDEMGGIAWEAGPDLSRDTVYLGGTPV